MTKRHAFEGKEYGFFFHFNPAKVEGIDDPVKAWDFRTKSFNVKKLARQMHELNAGYVFTTIGQDNGCFCAPNKAYTEVMGPGLCSERDVLSDFADALAEYGIDFYVYSLVFPPSRRDEACIRFQSVPPWNTDGFGRAYSEVKKFAVQDPRLKHAMTKWSEIHREWSTRWGRKVKGWWIDCGYFSDKLYDFPDEPNGHSFFAALRAGNPDAVVALNPGVMKPRRNYANSDEDYTAGEIDFPDTNVLCGDTVDGLRYHILTFAGSGWSAAPLRFNADELTSLTRTLVDNGCAVTWDLPYTAADGLRDSDFAVLKDFAEKYAESRKNVPALRINTVPPTCRTEGYVEFITKTPGTVKVLWNGKEETVQVPGKSALPFFAPGEQRLEIRQGGFKRYMRIFCGKAEYTLPFTAKTSNTECRLEKGNGKLKFTFCVKEPGKRIDGVDFWDNSGMEIFMETEAKDYRQYFAYENGRVISVGFGEPHTDLQKAVITKTPEGYTQEFELPLPEGKMCLLEIRTHVSDEKNKLRSEAFFGGSGSGFMKQYLYALIHL